VTKDQTKYLKDRFAEVRRFRYDYPESPKPSAEVIAAKKIIKRHANAEQAVHRKFHKGAQSILTKYERQILFADTPADALAALGKMEKDIAAFKARKWF